MASNIASIAAVVSAGATAVAAGSVAVAVSAATRASPKDLAEKVTPLAEAVGKNGATNAGTAVATGIVRGLLGGAGLLGAATICSALIISRRL